MWLHVIHHLSHSPLTSMLLVCLSRVQDSSKPLSLFYLLFSHCWTFLPSLHCIIKPCIKAEYCYSPDLRVRPHSLPVVKYSHFPVYAMCRKFAHGALRLLTGFPPHPKSCLYDCLHWEHCMSCPSNWCGASAPTPTLKAMSSWLLTLRVLHVIPQVSSIHPRSSMYLQLYDRLLGAH